jgi:hypothetical protein
MVICSRQRRGAVIGQDNKICVTNRLQTTGSVVDSESLSRVNMTYSDSLSDGKVLIISSELDRCELDFQVRSEFVKILSGARVRPV